MNVDILNCHKRITPCITNLLGKSVLREKQASLTIVVTVVSLIYVIKPLGALTQILVWRCHDFCDILWRPCQDQLFESDG